MAQPDCIYVGGISDRACVPYALLACLFFIGQALHCFPSARAFYFQESLVTPAQGQASGEELIGSCVDLSGHFCVAAFVSMKLELQLSASPVDVIFGCGEWQA